MKIGESRDSFENFEKQTRTFLIKNHGILVQKSRLKKCESSDVPFKA